MNLKMNRTEMITMIVKALGIDHSDTQNFINIALEAEDDDDVKLVFALIMLTI